jgi:hypothetical protein
MDKSTPATKKDLQESEARLRGEIAQMETRMVDRLTELVRDVETSLLTAFHGYGKGQSSRMHLLEVADTTFAQRLAALEDRVLNLETRRGPGAH